MVMRVTMDQKTLEMIVNYLVTKPFKEVQGIITLINQDTKKEDADGIHTDSLGK